ncbi:MAG: hypothetical protein HY862_22085 [Chloroflexi bacterium]|nr:hypothetical protein [Chloroflexota bacterium]
MHNRAFYRSLRSILHPIPIGAIILLLLNDHFLKRHYPSWWTGKLSDFAGLIFAPLIFAAFLAWIIPPRLKNQENLAGAIAFLSTGTIFALTKALPQANNITSGLWEFFTGNPVKIWLDPTDLLVLPALLIGWLVWDNNSNQLFRPLFPASSIMILGFLAALASTPGNADNGIVCLAFDKSSLIAWTGQHGSNDYLTGNGRIYIIDPDAITSNTTTANTRRCNHAPRNPVWELASPNDPNLIYRFALGQSIEVSENAGQNWQSVIDLKNISNENRMRAKDRTNIWTGFVAQPGPLDAVFDPAGNKLYVAMGLDGILVIQKDKEPAWISVGDYRFDVPSKVDVRFFELWPHLGMAVGSSCLTMVIINPKTHRKKRTLILYLFAL